MNRRVYVGSRLGIYISIAMLTSVTHNLGALDKEALEAMLWTDWTVVALAPFLAALIAARAYLDQSLSTKEKQ